MLELGDRTLILEEHVGRHLGLGRGRLFLRRLWGLGCFRRGRRFRSQRRLGGLGGGFGFWRSRRRWRWCRRLVGDRLGAVIVSRRRPSADHPEQRADQQNPSER
jgi:hypothetical protein